MLSLIRITAPYLVAGFEFDGVVRRAAPIIRYMTGWSQERVAAYATRKGWQLECVEC